MEYKIEQVVLCEVRVWGVVQADSMQDAVAKAMAIGTNSGEGLDHEIVKDIKTIAIKSKEA